MFIGVCVKRRYFGQGQGLVFCISTGRKGEDPRGDKEEDLSLRERRCNRKEENFIFLRA